jgi:ornithine cyclodeaminase/alanine dehydrogenase-like protein (mu-crystallin family)
VPMSEQDSVLFIDYATTTKLLSVPDAMAICENVFRMHARNSVRWSAPPSQKLDVGAPFHNHWHVKTVILEDEPIAGVRLYSYYDDGLRNTVGRLDCARYIVLADPNTARPIAILDEHWTYAIRSAAAAMVALKWLGPRAPRTLGLVGVGTMGENCLRCLRHLYKLDEIICTSRREETRDAFAAKWSKLLGIPVRPLATVEEVVRNADVAIGCTTRTDIVSREPWVKRGATFVSMSRREMDPAGWARFDKTVIDDWDCNMTMREFRDMLDAGEFSRAQLHAEIGEVVAGRKPGRERDDERILVHTTGMVSHDIGIAWWIYKKAKAQGLGVPLPTAVAQQAFSPQD